MTEENMKLAKLMARKYFCNIADCVRLMLPPGTGNKEVSNRVKEKVGNFVYLKKDEDELYFLIETGKIKSDKHIRVIKFLLDNDGVYLPDLEILADVSKSVINTMQKNGIIDIVEQQIERNPFVNKNVERDTAKRLTEEQNKCYTKIEEDIEHNRFSSNLIFGVTGSRKDRNIFAVDK